MSPTRAPWPPKAPILTPVLPHSASGMITAGRDGKVLLWTAADLQQQRRCVLWWVRVYADGGAGLSAPPLVWAAGLDGLAVGLGSGANTGRALKARL